MITISNYKEKTKGVNMSKFPDYIQEVHKDFDSYSEFYDEDADIKKVLDNHFAILDKKLADSKDPGQKAIKKPSSKVKPTKPTNTAKLIKKISKKTTKTDTNRTKPTKKTVRAKRKDDTAKIVESYSEEVRLIRRFNAAIGKQRQRRSILNIYRDFERRAVERKIKETSPYSDTIKEIQSRLKKAVDYLDKNNVPFIKIEAAKGSEKFYTKVSDIAKSTGLRTSAGLLKRFVGIEGENNPDKEKVERLHKAFESAIDKGKVCEIDLYWKEIKEAKSEMQNYLKGKTNKINISPQSLNGLGDIGLGKLNAVPEIKESGLNGTAKTKATISFNKSILDAKRNGYLDEDTFLLGSSQDVLRAELGGFKMRLLGSNLRKSMSKDKDHSLFWHNLINLPDEINKPAAIFKSKNVNKGYVILTEISDYRNKPFISAVHIDRRFNEILEIKSIYVKTRPTIYKRWQKRGLLIYANKKSDLVKRLLAPIAESAPTSQNKVTKKNNKDKLSGISQPEIIRYDVEIPKEPVPVPMHSAPEIKKTLTVSVNQNAKTKSSLFSLITDEVAESGIEKIQLAGDLGRFLGYVERYEYSILLRGDKGAGKTRLLYQMMNTFALAGFSVGSFSLEIGKNSNIVRDMRNTYLHPTIASSISIADQAPNGIKDIEQAAEQFDVVCVDSWGKIGKTEQDDFDKLRKKYPKTMFIIIFQSTTKGTARGGSMPEYDAGIVIQVNAGGLAVCEKNRYNGEDLTYLVFEQRLKQEEMQPA